MHSLNTPSRSTMRSCVRSSPSRCTFQYIQRDGAMTGLPVAGLGLRIASASFVETKPSEINPFSLFSKFFRNPVRAGLALFRSEEHTSELQSHSDIVCRLLLEKK